MLSQSPLVIRSALRVPLTARILQSRTASSATDAATKRAQDVLSTTQRTTQAAWNTTQRFLGPVGQRLESLLGSYREPIMYNLAVTREIAKRVYIAERLAPPNLDAIQSAYSTLWNRARSLTYWRELIRTGDWKKVGIYALEAYGIFKIGEIVGRRSLVGYDLH